MENKRTKATEVQGTEEAKKQKASKSGTVRSLAGVVRNLRETKLITAEENETLVKIYGEVVKRWMNTETLI